MLIPDQPVVVTPAAPQCPYFSTYVARGDSGREVQLVQKFLSAALGRTIAADGAFGAGTQQAVRDFQNQYSDYILVPWGTSTAPGDWFTITRVVANTLLGCDDMTQLPGSVAVPGLEDLRGDLATSALLNDLEAIRNQVTPAPALQEVLIGDPEPEETVVIEALRSGDSGPEVLALQQRLIELGYNVPETGTYGVLTVVGIKQFQAAQGIETTGVAGAATLQALGL